MAEPTLGEIGAVMQGLSMGQGAIRDEIIGLRAEFKILNGTVRDNCKDIAVLKDWRGSADKKLESVAERTVDLRVEIQKAASYATIIGLVLAGLMGLGRALGVF